MLRAAGAFPWALRLPEDDLAGFLAELSTAADGIAPVVTLAAVERVIATWHSRALAAGGVR